MTMRYDNPFPGMNPYLEDPLIWPDFHNRLIASMADNLGTRVPDTYRVGIQERTEVATVAGDSLEPALEPAFIAPDARVTDTSEMLGGLEPAPAYGGAAAAVAPPAHGVAVRVATLEEARVTYLYVQRMRDWKVVAIVEVLSPTNKMPGEGRVNYRHKRDAILTSGVSLVEIDLLRGGRPMPLQTATLPSDYRILVCRGWERPNAVLYPFSVRQAIPKFALPLSPGDDEPEVDLGPIINGMHHTARYSQVTRYSEPPPGPVFDVGTREWVDGRLESFRRPAPQGERL